MIHHCKSQVVPATAMMSCEDSGVGSWQASLTMQSQKMPDGKMFPHQIRFEDEATNRRVIAGVSCTPSRDKGWQAKVNKEAADDRSNGARRR